MIHIEVNGDDMSFENEVSVAELLSRLSVQGGAIAVEVNRDIVSKKLYDTHRLLDGDRVEIVTFVGGG